MTILHLHTPRSPHLTLLSYSSNASRGFGTTSEDGRDLAFSWLCQDAGISSSLPISLEKAVSHPSRVPFALVSRPFCIFPHVPSSHTSPLLSHPSLRLFPLPTSTLCLEVLWVETWSQARSVCLLYLRVRLSQGPICQGTDVFLFLIQMAYHLAQYDSLLPSRRIPASVRQVWEADMASGWSRMLPSRNTTSE